jgi:hypothetical protein
MELSMDITTDSYWGLHGLYVGLVDQNFFSFLAKSLNFFLRERLAF